MARRSAPRKAVSPSQNVASSTLTLTSRCAATCPRSSPSATSWDRINIADIVGVKVILLDEAPSGYAQFDVGAPVKFVIDPHGELGK